MLTKLRAWRTAQGYSLDEVSGLTGVSVPMLSRVENGQRQLAPHTRVVVARRLGVRLAELFDVEPIPEDAA